MHYFKNYLFNRIMICKLETPPILTDCPLLIAFSAYNGLLGAWQKKCVPNKLLEILSTMQVGFHLPHRLCRWKNLLNEKKNT